MKSRRSCVLMTLALSACGDGDPGKSGEASSMNGVVVHSVETTHQEKAADAAQTGAVKIGQAVLNSPSELQIAIAFHQIVGLRPPFDEWALSDPRVHAANEFDRPAVLARVRRELMSAAEPISDIGYFVLNMDSYFDEYDMTAQGFPIQGLTTGGYFSWFYQNRPYDLVLDNGSEARVWKIPVVDARRIVEGGGSRAVTVTLRIKIVNAQPHNGGGKFVGRIVGYQVAGRNGGPKLGEMTFPAA